MAELSFDVSVGCVHTFKYTHTHTVLLVMMDGTRTQSRHGLEKLEKLLITDRKMSKSPTDLSPSLFLSFSLSFFSLPQSHSFAFCLFPSLFLCLSLSLSLFLSLSVFLFLNLSLSF